MSLVFAQSHTRQTSLDKLFIVLAQSKSQYRASEIEKIIWEVWFISEDKEVDSLMQELLAARHHQDYKVALELSNEIIALSPDYAEGWNQRATIEFILGNYDKSLKDIVETLKREPRHFGALSGRAFIQLQQNKNKQAIETINQALKIHPFLQLRHSIPNVQNSQAL